VAEKPHVAKVARILLDRIDRLAREKINDGVR
jgi:hypothetical protein